MTERVAIVTGAGRGLGRVMALSLLSAGHRTQAFQKSLLQFALDKRVNVNVRYPVHPFQLI